MEIFEVEVGDSLPRAPLVDAVEQEGERADKKVNAVVEGCVEKNLLHVKMVRREKSGCRFVSRHVQPLFFLLLQYHQPILWQVCLLTLHTT